MDITQARACTRVCTTQTKSKIYDKETETKRDKSTSTYADDGTECSRFHISFIFQYILKKKRRNVFRLKSMLEIIVFFH